jgi:hypothetical protein
VRKKVLKNECRKINEIKKNSFSDNSLDAGPESHHLFPDETA